MDIAALSTSLSLQKVQSEAGVSLLKNSMDASQAQAAALIKMIEAINPEGMGTNIDITA